jgi:hypothetical protein
VKKTWLALNVKKQMFGPSLGLDGKVFEIELKKY